MKKTLIPGAMRNSLEDAMAGLIIRVISQEFDAAEIERTDFFDAGLGQRRNLIKSYLKSLDFENKDDAEKFLAVYRGVIERFNKEKSEVASDLLDQGSRHEFIRDDCGNFSIPSKLLNSESNTTQPTKKSHQNNASAIPKEIKNSHFFDMMHPTIRDLAKSRFESTHYADAVEASLKQVNVRVKEATREKWQTHGRKDLDGATLMTTAFSLTKPLIELCDLSDESGRNEQTGFMQIFSGAMTGIRNPKAHANVAITAERCLHLLMLSSLLMYRLDDAGVSD